MLWQSEELFVKDSDISKGYRTFDVHNDKQEVIGTVIVSSNPAISKALSENPKFETYRTIGSLKIFNSVDCTKYLVKSGGLPPNILKCIVQLFK